MRGRDDENTIHEATTQLIVILLCKYCQNIKNSVILALLSRDNLEKLRGFVWGYFSDLFP